MSLTYEQQQNTKKELKENLLLTGLTLEKVASDLETTTSYIEDLLNLKSKHIEDPWILKEYLEKTLKEQGKVSIPFTALKGDYHDYWFLNSRRIDKGKL